jgi:hypothetical protein
VLPFLLLYFLHKRDYKKYALLSVFGFFYCLSLMQKSFILTIFLPSIVYSLFYIKKLWKIFGINIFTVLIYIYVLLYVTNPALRGVEIPKEVKEKPSIEFDERNKIFAYAIYKRVLLIPGKMVADWFKHVPADKPFLKGCGYRFLAPVLNCEFHNYAQELYPIFYPEYAKRGIQGNVNVAHFVYDYANFGWKGLLLSGFVMGILLSLIEILFLESIVYKFSINIFYILMLSSSALTTLLFSGGWGLMILLYLLFKKDLLCGN